MKLDWHKFKTGNAEGLSIFTTDEYFKVYENGNTDPEMINDMIEEGLEGKNIYDVGAFIGLSSLVFSKYSKNSKIICFEPNPYNRERITKNFEKNKEFSKNIKMYPFALSNKNEQIDMYLSKIIEGPSSTSRISGAHSTISNKDLPDCFENCEVEAKTLDTFVKETKVIPDVMKVDIEGAEYMLLLGAIETVEKYHPLIYIELHSEYCALKCSEFLINQGYTLTIINEEPDNRIMVKAKYQTSKLNKEFNVNNLVTNYENSMISINSKLKIFNEELENLKEVKDLTKEKDELLIKIENLKIEYNELEKITNNLTNENKKLNANISDIINSKSWRITKPLRGVKKLFSKK